MSFIFSWRSYSILAQKQSINYRLYELQEKLLDLQKYSAAIADGVSLNDLSEAPSSRFGDMMNYMFRSHNLAVDETEKKFAYMQSCGAVPQMQNASMQQQYMNMIKSNLYEQAKASVAKQETKVRDLEERQIQMEIKKLQDQLAMLDAEEKSVNDAKDKSIANSAPKYIA